MNPRVFVKCMADVLDENAVFARAFDRSLSKAGLRKTSGAKRFGGHGGFPRCRKFAISIANGEPTKRAAGVYKKYNGLTSDVQ